ncbi:MAG: serine hydrolase [Chloroflexales bacterium]|nr:serine hydrolase [Chloroflexales bacterium]
MTAQPTAAPAPTPTAASATFLPGSEVAGVDVSGLTLEQGAALIREKLSALEQTLTVTLGDEQLALAPSDIALALPIDAMLAEATAQTSAGAAAQVPLRLRYDVAAVRSRLNEAAQQLGALGTTRLVSSTDTISRSFVAEGGQTLDVDQALAQIDEALRGTSRQVALALNDGAARVPREQLQQALEALAGEWDGVVGLYLYDAASGDTITINPDTVFSGASVLKVPIMLHAYAQLPQFSDTQQRWMQEMIVDSNNHSANALLSATKGSTPGDTEAALAAVRQMTEELKSLGLEHTYQSLPYESGDYLIKVRGMKIPKGPAQEGKSPFTEADPYVRTTPAEMGRLFVLLGQCAQGAGDLLQRYGESLTPVRCQEMLDWLTRNDDTTRMVAGLPAGTKVAHKSGWVEDMQADAGLVSSPGGDYVLTIYLYQKQRNSYLSDEEATPWLAAFSRLVYSAYNPGKG